MADRRGHRLRLAHLLLAGRPSIGPASCPTGAGYADTLREFLTGAIGDLTYDFVPWSPALLVGALYFCSAMAIGLLIRLRAGARRRATGRR